MKKQISLATSLFVTILATNVIMANGQNFSAPNFGPSIRQTDCFLHEDEHLVILDLKCDELIKVVSWYASQGYEIKAVHQDLQSLQTTMYLQK